MDKPQEQTFLRALHMLGGIIITCAQAANTQNPILAQTFIAEAEAYHKELSNLINPELEFPKHERQG